MGWGCGTGTSGTCGPGSPISYLTLLHYTLDGWVNILLDRQIDGWID